MPRPDPVIEAFLQVSNFLMRSGEVPDADWDVNEKDHSIEIYNMRSDLYLRRTPELSESIQVLCRAGRWLINNHLKV